MLHSFAGGTDGATPYSTLIRGKKGELYGTTTAGGSANLGTVFEISKKGVETVLHSFTGGNDGASPYAGLIFGPDGALYGTTYQGGISGLGTVYRITPSGNETVVHAFQGIYNNNDGSFPYGGLLLASDGNMYGATVNGGNASDNGSIYAIQPNGVEVMLYAFTSNGTNDGEHPYSNLIETNFYGIDMLLGTTASDGYSNGGYGESYFYEPHSYEGASGVMKGGIWGQTPIAALALGTDSENEQDILGTVIAGGASGLGAITLAYAENGGYAYNIYSFAGIYNASDGSYPWSAMVLGADGSYYGTTLKGGNSTDSGTIYSFAGDQYTQVYNVVYRFSGPDGSQPYGAVLEDKPGTFFGTTSAGGANNLGVVYKLVVK